jgi:hypothetical protein
LQMLIVFSSQHIFCSVKTKKIASIIRGDNTG